jgi:16S rRNA U516 pseudouridylate synthase RsuA-like enzyme
MDEDYFNMSVRKFLKEVGVTSQREIERIVREGAIKGTSLRLRMTLTSADAPALEHVVETTIELR